MLKPGRVYTTGIDYRYSINGQEKTTEIAPNTTTAEFWQYDARIVRRWNVDPRPNPSISVYNCFAGNPIWYRDNLGDSIVDPKRTKAFNVIIIAKDRDKVTNMSAKRLITIAEKNKDNTILIEANEINKDVAENIIKQLGDNGYVGTLIIDYHRSDYDDKMPDKEDFYSTLANGYSGYQTTMLAGMCWAGGGVPVGNNPHYDITDNISKSLDRATVYGLKTEASSLPFKLFGNFGSISPDYFFSGEISKWERKYRSTWTVTSYNPELKKYQFNVIKAKVILTMEGALNVKLKKQITSGDATEDNK